ncbi:MAG: TatA/E family twin arginine-targeting protein translocase [Chloroflexi bacterium]|nr:TatA/E family twin arginine-targeting protein translocase [Chloroflexota bacterium]
MDFFGIGFGEVLLILILALIIWGPKRLPDIARTLGKTMRAMRKATNDFTSQVTRDIDIEAKESREKKQLAPPKDTGIADKDTARDE